MHGQRKTWRFEAISKYAKKISETLHLKDVFVIFLKYLKLLSRALCTHTLLIGAEICISSSFVFYRALLWNIWAKICLSCKRSTDVEMLRDVTHACGEGPSCQVTRKKLLEYLGGFHFHLANWKCWHVDFCSRPLCSTVSTITIRVLS